MATHQHITANATSSIFLILSVFALATSPATAQTTYEPLTPFDIDYKSPEKAVRLSLFSTLIPLAAGGGMVLAGLAADGNSEILTAVGLTTGFLGITFGPSVGHSYAKSSGKGAVGIGIRLATSFTGGVILALPKTQDQYFSFSGQRTRRNSNKTGIVAGILFSATAISAVHDILTAGKSAKAYNSRNSQAITRLTPTYFARYSAPGLSLQISF